jgi:hypothetical protein
MHFLLNNDKADPSGRTWKPDAVKMRRRKIFAK